MILPARLAEIAAKLDALGLNYVFVGGSIVEFLLDNPGLSPMRPTDDLDLMLKSWPGGTTPTWSKNCETLVLRTTCRQVRRCAAGCDIMPTDGALLGLNTAWFAEALTTARPHIIGGVSVPLISSVAFIATKLAAFADRGAGDYHGSHDLEDIITVIDGRAGIVDEVAQAEPRLRIFVETRIGSLVTNENFQDSLSGQLPFDAASQHRLPALRQKLRLIADL